MTKRLAMVALAMGALSGFSARRVEVECDTLDLDEYREYAKLARELGATHLSACQVEPSMWQWDAAQNRRDPYPNWSMHRPTIFKFVVPEKLKPYLDTKYAARNLARLRERAKVLDEYGLKASFTGQEPAYLPEQAYLDHPKWRGPRCDQCRRAMAEYYAPCTDDPEVRELYREGMAMLCREVKLEKFEFMSNDSGAGFCWYPHLYPGINGPARCREKPIADRIVDFMSVLQQGAADAGITDLKVNMDRKWTPEILAVTLPKLRKNQSAMNRTAENATVTRTISFPNPFAEQSYPIYAMPRMVKLVEQLQVAEQAKDADISITLRSLEETDTIRLLRTYWGKRQVGAGLRARLEALMAIAETFVGAEHAEELVKVWQDYEEVYNSWSWARFGAHIFLCGTTQNRWLTRPLVCFPEELKPEEKRYYRDYILQAEGEEEADDLCNMQAHCCVSGYGGMFAVSRVYSYCTNGKISGAIAAVERLVKFARDDESARYLKGYALKLRLYLAVARNAVHAVEFQQLVNEGKARNAAIGAPKKWHGVPSMQDDRGFEVLNEVIRNEIDNTLEVVEILEQAKREGATVIQTAARDEFTNVMNLPPVERLIRELKLKVKIMEGHRREVARIYRSNNH